MVLFGLIGAGVGAILLVIGVLGLFSARIRTMLRGIPVANKLFDPMTWSVIFVVVGLLAGGTGVLMSYLPASTASLVGGQADDQTENVNGLLTITLSDGVTNSSGIAVTTEDYLNDAEDFMTFYSADANIADGEEYRFNVTIEREQIAEDGNVKVTCTAKDKELSGLAVDNLIEKTNGQVDIAFAGSSTSAGSHSDDNTVWTYVAFAEGDGSQVIQVTADQEETYHDAMSDLDDYIEINCDADGVPFNARIYANS